MPRRRDPSRLVCALLLAAVAVVAAGTVVAADLVGPGDESPEPAPNRAQLVPPTTSPLTPEEARAHLQSRREARRADGKASVGDQLRAYPDVVDPNTMYVVASFSTPMPLTVYRRQGETQGPYALGADVVSITTYLELAGGYPITSTGSPDDDFVASISAFLSEPTTQARLQEARAPNFDVEDRMVILGFAMKYPDFERLEPELRSRFDLAAAEVVDSPDVPPIGPSEPVTGEAVDSYEHAYLEGRVGR